MISLYKNVNDRLECQLCPRFCKIAKGRTGICGVRKNTGTKVELQTYGVLSGYSLDPIEKKPLYHFFPGYEILSVGSYGCNMRCDFCQNFGISQHVPEKMTAEKEPEDIVGDALSSHNNIGIAFTYNEPSVSIEFMLDVAILAKEKGLFTVMVSNGFVNPEPMNEIIKYIDAFNIDLKAFNQAFYRKLTGSDIEPVKNSLKQIAKAGKHLEVTTLVIPGKNDDADEMKLQAEWIKNELGRSVPLHLSRYFPMYRRNDPATPMETLDKLVETASEILDYVYMGNTHSDKGQNTMCHACGTAVTKRSGYVTRLMNLTNEGNCKVCGNLVYKNFNFISSKDR
jgi:pyruvate formate lyase activating enzyme